MIARIYLSRDSKRGINGTYEWLKEEVEELGDAIRNNRSEAMKDEFADVIAWLASLANLLEIDIEKAALKKYNNRCPRCDSSPCICTYNKH
jgi:NTP pyrophosphatase (non-canonical NTP hydrolase)